MRIKWGKEKNRQKFGRKVSTESEDSSTHDEDSKADEEKFSKGAMLKAVMEAIMGPREKPEEKEESEKEEETGKSDEDSDAESIKFLFLKTNVYCSPYIGSMVKNHL